MRLLFASLILLSLIVPSAAAVLNQPEQTEATRGNVLSSFEYTTPLYSRGEIALIHPDDVPVTEIRFTARRVVSEAGFTVNYLKNRSISTQESPPGIVEAYLQIETIVVTNANTQDIHIRFRVPWSWVNQNNIDLTSIRLRKWSGTYWDALTTTQVTGPDSNSSSSSQEYLYFETPLSGFSYFAITGERSEVPLICTAGDIRCQGSELQGCSNGTEWATVEDCTYTCNATSLSCDPAPQQQPEPECQPGDRVCSGSNLQVCTEGEWNLLPCEHGCSGGACIEPEPSQLPVEYIIISAIAAAFLMAGALLVRKGHRGRKRLKRR